MNPKWAKRYNELLKQYGCRNVVEEMLLEEMQAEQQLDIQLNQLAKEVEQLLDSEEEQ